MRLENSADRADCHFLARQPGDRRPTGGYPPNDCRLRGS